MVARARSTLLAVLVATALTAPAALAMTTAQSSPARAATLGPVTTTVVHGPCHAGGSLVVQVDRTDNGYLVTATGRDLPNNSHWRIYLDEGSNSDSSIPPVGGVSRAEVHHGGWTVSQTVKALPAPFFDVFAVGPGKVNSPHGRYCLVAAQPAKPFLGLTFCHKEVEIAMAALPRANGSLVTLWAMFGAKPGSRWAVRVDATTGDSAIGVGSTGTAGRGGHLSGNVTFHGSVNPRLRLRVVAAGGQRCTLQMHRVLADPEAMRSSHIHARAGMTNDPAAFAGLRSLLAKQAKMFHAQR